MDAEFIPIATGLDVFNNEPAIFPAYAALLNVFMLPHIGSSTTEARQAMVLANSLSLLKT